MQAHENTHINAYTVESKILSVSLRIWQETKISPTHSYNGILIRNYYGSVTRTEGSNKEC